MKYLFLLLAFFLPSLSFGALTISQASSTHALGFDAVGDFAGLSEVRIFAPGTPAVHYARTYACAVFSYPSFHPNVATNNLSFSIRPSQLFSNNLTSTSITANYINYYNCFTNGVHTVGIFSNSSATSASASDTIYLEQMPLDHRSIFVILFLVGALLAVLRPLISKLTLR